ncbi:hypothetical protein IH981_00640 [Patescibacteria group bacterium]|nr:hypothetical protein [Patescibacteria group bacterium]
MGEIVSCPYGCAVRWGEDDLRWWFEHVRLTHREKLPKWLRAKVFWGLETIDLDTTVLYQQWPVIIPNDEEMEHLANLVDEDSPESQEDTEEVSRYLRELAEKYPVFRLSS